VTHARSLRRFEEELSLLHSLLPRLPASARAAIGNPFAASRNALLDEFATRLAAGEREAAQRLTSFIDQSLPPRSGMPPTALLRAAVKVGRPAGKLLKALETAWIRLALRRIRRCH
jgi:hypothetical protein